MERERETVLGRGRWRRLKIIPSDRLVIDCRGVEKWGKIDYIVRRELIVVLERASGPCQEHKERGSGEGTLGSGQELRERASAGGVSDPVRSTGKDVQKEQRQAPVRNIGKEDQVEVQKASFRSAGKDVQEEQHQVPVRNT